MVILTKQVARSNAELLPENSVLIFDGQSTDGACNTRALQIGAPNNLLGFRVIYKSISLVEDDKEHDANEHISFMELVIIFISEIFDNVAAPLSDGCFSNRTAA